MAYCSDLRPDLVIKMYIFFTAVKAHGVLSLIRSLLDKFPCSSTVRAAIFALTVIANDTVVHVPDQVSYVGFVL